MSHTEYEYGLRRQAKMSAQQQLKIEFDRINQQLQKNNAPQKKVTPAARPQLTLKLTPMSQTSDKKPIEKEIILWISKHLRNTHLPNGLALALQIIDPRINTERDQKLQAARDTFKKRWQVTQQQLKHVAAEHEFEHKHKIRT